MFQQFSGNQQQQQSPQNGMGFGGDIYGNQQPVSMSPMNSPTTATSGMTSGGGMPTAPTANQGYSMITFMFLTFLNVICVAMCFAGTFTPQMVSTTHESFSKEISIYFDHAEIFISDIGPLPSCIADKYDAGKVMGIIAGVCSILALFSGVISACCNQSKSPLRFARSVFAGIACVFAIVAIGISKSGGSACDGAFDTYKGGAGAALLIVAVVLTGLVAGGSLARELLCPEMKCVSRNAHYGLQLQSQQIAMMQHISSQQQQMMMMGSPGGFPNQQQPQYPMEQQQGGFQTPQGGFPQQQPDMAHGQQPQGFQN